MQNGAASPSASGWSGLSRSSSKCRRRCAACSTGRARTRALVRHARAVDAIFEMQERGGKASPEQVEELQEARKVFEEARPYGSHDAEAAYKKNPELAQEAATGRVNRAVRALQLETELRTDPQRRADRFVERWRSLDRASQRQYRAGDMSGHRATRSAMGDMAKSLERDPQLESILEGRKRDLGIGIDSGWNSPSATVSTSAEVAASDCRTVLFFAPYTLGYDDASNPLARG
jgi:hypothetical protein